MAAVRTGQPVSAESGILSDNPDVKAALTSPHPSEIFVNGLISSQLSTMQRTLEENIEAHVTASMKAQMHDVMMATRREVPGLVTQAMDESAPDKSRTSNGQSHHLLRNPCKQSNIRLCLVHLFSVKLFSLCASRRIQLF